MRTSRPVLQRRGPARVSRALVLLAFALCLSAAAGVAGAQSGRKKTPPLSPAPTPSPTPEEQGESESEGRPKREPSTEASFIVYQADESFPFIDHTAQELVMESFMRRLTRSKDLSATRGTGKLSRKQAQEIAKKEPEAYIVLIDFEQEAGESGRGGVGGQADTRGLVIRTYTYEPNTGTLKFVDYTSQRPYRPTTTIGGVRLPLPVPGTRIERFPNELQLEQAAQDAADRIMRRFNLRLPPDN